MEPVAVVPMDPFAGFPFDLTDGLPGAEQVDDFCFEEPDDGFGQSVVVTIPHTAYRRINPRLQQPLAIGDG